ncbi:MAG: glycosyltransferase [Nitrososphaera sp.]
MPSTADFSVIMPTFNGSQFIGEALASLSSQSFQPSEVIAVDDSSTDNTVEVLETAVRTLNFPLRIIRLERNTGGPAKPMNIGVSQARGKYILVLDQDDILAKDALRLHYKALSSSMAPVASVTWCARYGDLETRILQDTIIRETVLSQSAEIDEYYMLPSGKFAWLMICHGTIPVGFPGFAFPKKLWEQSGGFNEKLKIAVDFDFLCKLCASGQVALIPEVGFFHRFHSQNACNNRSMMYYELACCTARSAAFYHKSHAISQQEFVKIHHRIAQIYRKAGNLFASNGNTQKALYSWLKASVYDYNFVYPAKQLIKLALRYTGFALQLFCMIISEML